MLIFEKFLAETESSVNGRRKVLRPEGIMRPTVTTGCKTHRVVI